MTPKARKFLDCFRETYNYGKALRESGYNARLIRKLTEPRFTVEYDEEFASEYMELMDELRAAMMDIGYEVAVSDSRQKLTAAKWVAANAEAEHDRVEAAHIKYLEEGARKSLTGSHGLSLEGVKGGDGGFDAFTKPS